MSKIKIEDIQAILAEKQWKLISTEYNNLDTEMIFECPEGHRVFSSWKKMRSHFSCPTCEVNNLANQDGTILAKAPGVHRILTLDQASHSSGYAVFDDGRLIKYGVFKTDLDDEIARCSLIKSWLVSMIKNWKPDVIGLEGIQFQDKSSGREMGVTVFQTLARLQGILLEACYTLSIPAKVCPTNTWRHACGVKGRSRADKKRSMQLLVKQWYDITVTDDESDAIGIGHYLTHLYIDQPKIQNWEQ